MNKKHFILGSVLLCVVLDLFGLLLSSDISCAVPNQLKLENVEALANGESNPTGCATQFINVKKHIQEKQIVVRDGMLYEEEVKTLISELSNFSCIGGVDTKCRTGEVFVNHINSSQSYSNDSIISCPQGGSY